MDINTRVYDKWIDVTVDVDRAHHDLGFHGIDEAKSLLEDLESAVDDLRLCIDKIKG